MATATTMENEAAVIDRHIRVPDAVRLTSMSRSWLYSAMDSGRLPYARYGRSRRIPLSALQEFMRKAVVGGSDG